MRSERGERAKHMLKRGDIDLTMVLPWHVKPSRVACSATVSIVLRVQVRELVTRGNCLGLPCP